MNPTEIVKMLLTPKQMTRLRNSGRSAEVMVTRLIQMRMTTEGLSAEGARAEIEAEALKTEAERAALLVAEKGAKEESDDGGDVGLQVDAASDAYMDVYLANGYTEIPSAIFIASRRYAETATITASDRETVRRFKKAGRA